MRKNENFKKRKEFITKKLILDKQLISAEIKHLLSKADYLLSSDEDLAQRYFLEARKLQMKSRTKFPPDWKKRMCKNCKNLLKPGVNARVRLSNKKFVVIKCEKCGHYTRIPYYNSSKVTDNESVN